MTPHIEILPPFQLCICGNSACTVPFGFCHCECGNKTKTANKNDRTSGRVFGMPVPYIKGHNGRIRPTIENAVPFKIDGVYCRLIPLTKGQFAIVDATDYKWLMQWKWHARWNVGMKSFYASRKVRVKGKLSTIQMHREILGLKAGDPRNGDHRKSGETLLNARSNLRIATKAENSRNHRKRVDNTSGYIGAFYHKNSGWYYSFIVVNNERIYLGTRRTAKEAHEELYVPAAIKYHKDFSRTK